VKIFVARFEGSPVGACIVLLYKGVVYEWFWGVERTKSIYPAECITWHRIEWGLQNGYDLYDFGGAGWPNKPYGVREFKAKFGGDLVNYGRYRKVYSAWKFTLAEKGYDFVRNAVNPRNWRPSAGGDSKNTREEPK
jgi:lipid II:glycine glycyltransferase (peptidoglycan interpeptide bridge formation enzyme)